MNHLEQLVSEWLQYNDYFVRTSVQVGPRPRGGFEGELDVVGLKVATGHLIHVECSLDSDSWARREENFVKKFDRGRRFVRDIFKGVNTPEGLDQVALLQYANGARRHIGGCRLVTAREFVLEIFDGLKGTTPARGAVPSTYPLVRTLQLAAHAQSQPSGATHRLIPE